ncbi:GyrI-like domain-containing protein [Acanthopleuribacter pedis]|uniref:GyrI-like domain-containing protein n=1 Tax=Acanthopleuribacter pedis TaxID=442870 RepID=A0A8J7U5B8_9BACT|nr:GyrI-like domain-containing protein [Acanthopleuribacter pedis]MBO1322383.1 GyrI-like domain-containing protein [Acanthopleuribacter pedis]
MTEKIDLYKSLKQEYAAPKKPRLVQTTDALFLAITGRGAPGGEGFQESVAALYAVAYTVKMTRKADGLQDYVICKLETEWWGDDAETALTDQPRAEWNYRLQIRTPDCVDEAEPARAAAALIDKGKSPRVRDVVFHRVAAHQRGQLLHVGPYDAEGDAFEQIRAMIEGEGLTAAGHPREIYLNDPRRTAPEKLKTILCMPVAG